MKTIERLRNWITTIMGTILMIAAVAMYVMGKFKGHEFNALEITLVAVLGWLLLNAKDTILEGIFLNIFKMKRDEKSEKGDS